MKIKVKLSQINIRDDKDFELVCTLDSEEDEVKVRQKLMKLFSDTSGINAVLNIEENK